MIFSAPNNKNKMNCPKGHKRIIGVEYWYDNPYRYDGVSEIRCLTCKKRYGRWTSKILEKNEQEPPYGNQSYIMNQSNMNVMINKFFPPQPEHPDFELDERILCQQCGREFLGKGAICSDCKKDMNEEIIEGEIIDE